METTRTNGINWWNKLKIHQREQILMTSKELNRLPITGREIQVLYMEHFNNLHNSEQ